MIKRTIEISQQPVHLTVKNGQLLIQARDPEHTLLGTAPCEDIGVLLVEEQGVTYSHAALTTLIQHDAAVVICGRDHLPAGLLLPLSEHTLVVWRVREQVAAPKPLKKQLWKQIIQAKIRAQAANLLPGSASRSKLLELARHVRSGDPENVEAQAARTYWAAWRQQLHDDESHPIRAAFLRDPEGSPPNALLNYGYAVMRAAVARALVAAGLLPVLGIKHANRSNSFCLADDLVEPLRPIVDRRVTELVRAGVTEVNPQSKRGLLELLAAEVISAGQSGPLMVALHRYAASLAKCFEGTATRLEVPSACS